LLFLDGLAPPFCIGGRRPGERDPSLWDWIAPPSSQFSFFRSSRLRDCCAAFRRLGPPPTRPLLPTIFFGFFKIAFSLIFPQKPSGDLFSFPRVVVSFSVGLFPPSPSSKFSFFFFFSLDVRFFVWLCSHANRSSSRFCLLIVFTFWVGAFLSPL